MKQQRGVKLGQDYSPGALARKQAIKIHKGLKGQITFRSLQKGRLVGMHNTQIDPGIWNSEKEKNNITITTVLMFFFQIIITKTIDVDEGRRCMRAAWPCYNIGINNQVEMVIQKHSADFSTEINVHTM